MSRAYNLPPIGKELCQGEVLGEVTEWHQTENSRKGSELELVPVSHRFALVLSAACDLETDFRLRNSIMPEQQRAVDLETDGAAKIELQQKYELDQMNLLHSILLCVAYESESVRNWFAFDNSWDKAKQNDLGRYHFLCSCEYTKDAEKQGLPSLVLDFRHVFSLPTQDVYDLIESGSFKRRSCLAAPYREDLTVRFTNHISRVGLEPGHWDLMSLYDGKESFGRLDSMEGTISFEEAKKQIGQTEDPSKGS